MTEPLALVFYEKLLPGQQLVNRLHDLGYRVQSVTNPAALQEEIEKQKPMVLIAEFAAGKTVVHETIAAVKQNPETAHVSILVYIAGADVELQKAAQASGANLVASERGLIDQLPELLDHALRLD